MTLLDELASVHDRLRDAGYQVVSCVSRYGDGGAHFSTRLSLDGPEGDQDHFLLDALREISVEWSNARHDAKLRWQDV